MPQSAIATDDLEEGPIRVLVITGGHGFEEKPFAELFESISDVTATMVTYPDAAGLLKPELTKPEIMQNVQIYNVKFLIFLINNTSLAQLKIYK